MSFEVVVDYEALDVSAGGTVAAPIYIISGGAPFPDAAWWDFPCVVLGWWLAASREHGQCFGLRFMDGPAVIDVTVDEADVAQLKGKLESNASAGFCWAAAVSLRELRSEVHRAAEALVRVCEMRGLPTDGLDRLL